MFSQIVSNIIKNSILILFLDRIVRIVMGILFASAASSLENARAIKAGRLRKVAPKLFTDDLKSPAEEIVRRHRLEIAAHFYPGAIISHRSALENNVSPGGRLHLTLPGAVAPVRQLPGLEIRIWRGPAAQCGPNALPNDSRIPVAEGLELFQSGQVRAVLENLQIARAHGDDEPKTLSDKQLELWLDRYLRIFGWRWLKELHEQAQGLAARLNWPRELQELNQIVAAIRGEKNGRRLTTEVLRSRSHRKPFDPERLTLFGTLQARLAAERFAELPRPAAPEFENRAFWEAYFSNFIEGTKFTVEEARAIVYDPQAAKALEHKRPDDAHEVRETYRLIIDPKISGEVPRDASHLLELLKRRHARMMASRLAIEPGVFKKTNNEFGSRVFVAPELVTETLARGWQAIHDLPHATARALYMLFLIAEVHPFNDGNGRISRLGMNAELEAAGQARLVLSTSLRNDYLTVLEALTANGNFEPFITFAHKLIDLNSRMPVGSFDESLAYFRRTGALDEQAVNFGLISAMK